jgi:hypothetical protein
LIERQIEVLADDYVAGRIDRDEMRSRRQALDDRLASLVEWSSDCPPDLAFVLSRIALRIAREELAAEKGT